jgi:hypothetical protein
MVLTIIKVLTSISKAIPVMVLEGMLTRKSRSNAKAATKNAKKICQ